MTRETQSGWKFSIAYFTTFCLAIVAYIISRSHLYRVYAYNGDFQNFNPVRRFNAGQVPYVDFFPYTSTLPMYVISKISWILGIRSFVPFTLFMQIITPIMCGLVIIWFINTVIRNRSEATVMACLLISICMTLPFFYILTHLIEPEHTVLMIRCLPSLYLSAGLAYYAQKTSLKRLLLLSALTGITFVWSNDYAAAALILMPICVFLFGPAAIKTKIAHMSLLAVCTAAVFYICVMALTHGHPAGYFSFNSSVAATQPWYFSPGYMKLKDKLVLYKVGNITDILTYYDFIYGTLYVALVGLVYHRQKTINTRTIFVFLLFLYVGGLVATLGGQLGHYLFPLNVFGAIFMLVLITHHAIEKWRTRTSDGIAKKIRMTAVFLPFVILLIPNGGYLASRQPRKVIGDIKRVHEVSIKYRPIKTMRRTPFFRYDKPQKFYSPQLAGYVEQPYIVLVDFFQAHKDSKIFSVYATAGEISQGTFQQSGIDYIIHALGPNYRERFAQAFEGSEYVVTLNPRWVAWEYWVMNANWYLYQKIFQNYHVIGLTKYHVFWKRNEVDATIARKEKFTAHFNETTSQLDITPCPPPQTKRVVEVSLLIHKPKITFQQRLQGTIRDVTQVRILPVEDNNRPPMRYLGIPLDEKISFPYSLDMGCSIQIISEPNPMKESFFKLLAVKEIDVRKDVVNLGYFQPMDN